MNPTLQDAKRELRRRFFSDDTIHGLGIAQDRQAVVVYVTADSPLVSESSPLYQEMAQAAAPFKLEVVVQPMAVAFSFSSLG